MSEISKEELETEIANILKDADLATTSTKKVRQALEKKYGVSLVDRKNEIDKLVMEYVDKMKDEEEEDVDEEEVEEEEEEVKPKVKKEKETKSRTSRNSSKRKNENNDDNDEELEESPKKRNRKVKEEGKPKKPRKAGGGYTRVCQLSPALSELMGSDQMARHEVVKKVWTLIKENNLYDPNNKHFAVCDDSMYKVFGVRRFRAFGMMKYLKNHFVD